MKVDAFTYALMNNIDPVTGNPTNVSGGFSAKQLYGPTNVQGMPGSGGYSKYMTGYSPGMEYQHVRSANQGVVDGFFNGVIANIGLSTLSKIGQGIGIIGNIPQAVQSQDITKLFDNAVYKAFEEMDETAKEAMPVYRGRDYEGNLATKMMTTDFWFNDGFDAVSFLLSAYAPGGAVSKLSSISKLGKLAAPINALGNQAKSVKVANLLKGVTEKGIEGGVTQAVSTAYNTVTEAGFEAKDTFDNTFEEYKKHYSEEEARQKASEAAARVFTANAVGLLLPNAIQSSFMHGKNSFNLKRIKDMVRENKALEDILKNRAGYLKEGLKGIASEGLWEENFQGSVSRYEERMAEGWVGNMPSEYAYGMFLGLRGMAKAFTPWAAEAGTDEDEAATSVALGGIIGGGMSQLGTYQKRSAMDAAISQEQLNWTRVKLANAMGKNFLINNYTVGLKKFGTKDELDAEGNPTGNKIDNYLNPATNEVEINAEAMQNLILRRTRDMNLNIAQLDAVLSNNKPLTELNKEMALMSYAWHLKSLPNVSKEDIDALLEYDVKLPVRKELEGVLEGDILEKNLSSLKKYMDLWDQATETVGGMYDFSGSEVEQEFGAMMKQAYFYDAAKKQAFENMLETSSDTIKPQLQAMIQDIGAHLKGFRANLPAYQRAYNAEIAPGIQAVERLEAIQTKLRDNNTPLEERANLEAEQKKLEYVITELLEVDNYYKEDFSQQRAAEYTSATFSKGEPARHRTKKYAPLSKKEKFYYNKAVRTLFNMEIAKELASPTPVQETAQKVMSRPELALDDANKTALLGKLNTAIAEMEANSTVSVLEAVRDNINSNLYVDSKLEQKDLVQNEYELQDYHDFLGENYADIETGIQTAGLDANIFNFKNFNENPNLLLDYYKEIDAEAKSQNLEIERMKALRNGVQETIAMSDNLLKDQQDLEKKTPEQINEILKFDHFKDQVADIEDVLNRFKKEKDDFAANVDPKISKLNRFKGIFEQRDDISDSLKQRVLDQIQDYLEQLEVAREVSAKNQAKRYEVQKLSEVAYSESLKEVLANQELLDIFREVFGDQLDGFLNDIATYSKEHSMEGYEALIEAAKQTATPEQSARILEKLLEIVDNTGKDLKTKLLDAAQRKAGRAVALVPGAFEKIEGFMPKILGNPNEIARIFMESPDLLGERVSKPLTGEELDAFQKFLIDGDFVKAYYNITTDPIRHDASKAELEVLDILFDAYSKARAFHGIYSILTSEVSGAEMYKFEATQFSQSDKKTPTAQQAISFREAVRQLTSEKLQHNKSQAPRSLVLGIFGSGKTVMVGKKIMEFLIPDKTKRKEQVLAFAQSEETSKKIAESVGGQVSSYEALAAMTAEQLEKIKYFVIDEAFTLHDNQIEAIQAAANALGIRTLYLGDPSQNKSESTHTLQKNTTKAQPLTVVLRTNNPAITNFASLFQYNPFKVSDTIAEATSTLENKADRDSGVYVTDPNRNAEDQIVELAKQNPARSKIIISNHNAGVYKTSLQGVPNVKVLTPRESQGQEADEVYVDIIRSGEDVNGQAFKSELDYNTMMATAASRAVKVLVVANRPGTKITPIVQPNLEETIHSLEAEFEKYERDYKESLDAYQHFLSKFVGIKLDRAGDKAKSETAEGQKETPVTDHEKEKEPPAHSAPGTPRPEPSKEDIILKYPQNDNMHDVHTGQGLIVKGRFGNERLANEKWFILAPSGEGFKIVGALSAEEIGKGDFTEMQKRRALRGKDLFSFDSDKTLTYTREQLAQHTVGTVNVKYVRPLSFKFGRNMRINSATVQKLMRDFFQKMNVDLKGSVKASVKIYTDPNKQAPSIRFRPEPGIPYLVLEGFELPEENKSSFPRQIHIPINAPRINKNSRSVKAISTFKADFDELSKYLQVNPEEFFNSKEFEDMVDGYAQMHTQDTNREEGKQVVPNQQYAEKIGEFTQKYKLNEQGLQALYKVMNALYAPEKHSVKFTAAEFETWKLANQDKEKPQWTPAKIYNTKKEEEFEKNRLGVISYIKKNPRTGKLYAEIVSDYRLSINEGAVSKAWEEFASSNQSIGGYYPRVTIIEQKGTARERKKTTSKAFYGSRQSKKRALRKIKDYFNEFVAALERERALMDPSDPDYSAMLSLIDAIDMYSDITYSESEYDKVLDKLHYLTSTGPYKGEPIIHPALMLYKQETKDGITEIVPIEPEEELQREITAPVPYAALEAIANDENYLEDGSYKTEQSLYANLHRQKDGTITMDMGEETAEFNDPETFDKLGFTSATEAILPTEVIFSFGKAEPQSETAPPAEQTEGIPPVETPEFEALAANVFTLINRLATLTGRTKEDIIEILEKNFGNSFNKKAVAWLNSEIAAEQEVNNEDEGWNPDNYEKQSTVFSDTVPGKLVSLEWAKTLLQKLLPGLDISRQVEFLDELQMQVFEQADEDILGQVHQGIMRLKMDENKRVHDQVVYHEAFHMAWNYLFSDKLKTRLRAAFRAEYGDNVTDAQISEGLAELYQRYEQRDQIKKSWIRRLLEDIRAFFDVMYRHRLLLDRTFFNLDTGKYSQAVQANLKEGAPNNMQFVKANFGSQASYIRAVQRIKNRIHDYIEQGTAASRDFKIQGLGLPMTRNEIFDTIFRELESDLDAQILSVKMYEQELSKHGVKSFKELRAKVRGKQELLKSGTLEYGSEEYTKVREEVATLLKLEKLLENRINNVRLLRTLTGVNKKSGNYVFNEIVENLYPSYKASDDYATPMEMLSEDDINQLTEDEKESLDLDESTISAEVKVAFQGLRAETADTAKINWASKQSLALKDFFSFIPLLKEDSIEKEKKEGRNIIINNKVAYVKALQLILKLDLNSSSTLLEQIDYLYNTEDISRWDRSILSKIMDLFINLQALEERNDPWTIVARTYPLDGRADYYFFVDQNGDVDAHTLTYDDARDLVNQDPNRYKLLQARENSLINLYEDVNSSLMPITREDFASIFKGREAINTIANLQSFMGSLKDTEYIISIKQTRGKRRSLETIIAQSNDYLVNNKSLLKEAIKDNFASEKPLFKDSEKIKEWVSLFKSNDIRSNRKALNELLEALNVKRDFPIINEKLLAKNSNNIAEMLATLSGVTAIPTKTITYIDNGGVEQREEIEDIDLWIFNNNSALSSLSKIVAKETQHPKPTSIISTKKNRIYKHTLSNPIYQSLNKVIDYQQKLMSGNKWVNIAKLPTHIEILQQLNPFVRKSGKSFQLRIHNLFELDGHKDKYSNIEIANDTMSFDKRKLHTVLFSSSFVSNLRKGTYRQLLYQQGDKPRPIGAVLDIIGFDKLHEIAPVILDNIEYFNNPDRAAFFKMHAKTYNTNFVNAKLFKEALEIGGKENFVEAFEKILAREAIKLAKDLVAARTDTVGSEDQVSELLKKFNTPNHRGKLLGLLNEALVAEGLPVMDKFSPLSERAIAKGGTYNNDIQQFLPFAYAYLMNHYVNSYFLNQLVINSSQFFMNGKDVLKRMSGAGGPGHTGWRHPRFGIKEKTKVVVVGDPEVSMDEIFSQVLRASVPAPTVEQIIKANPTAENPKELLAGLTEAHETLRTINDYIAYNELLGTPVTERTLDSLAVLRQFFGQRPIEKSDGQVFILPSRLRNLQKGYGREFRLANILKPKYFGNRTEKNQETGEIVSIPTYIKPSAVVLSDELLYTVDENGLKQVRPGMEGLSKMRERMERFGHEELIFGSSVKLGKPQSVHSLNDYLNSEQEPTQGTLLLDNEHYQIQLNPRAKVNSDTAIFSQLMYFLNIYSSSPNANNIKMAETIYSAISFLYEKGGKVFERRTKGTEFDATVMKAFSEKGEEMTFANLLANGVSPTSPIFEKKVLIKLASLMEQLSIKIRLPGGKLVLQSDVEVMNPHTGKPLRFKQKNGKLVAEVIVPRGIFPPDIQKQIEKGETVFDTPVLLGFRIPSTELHSAIAMEVVGFYDNDANTNMVIAPELLIALHGSDFDVDSLFFAKRPTAKKRVATSTVENIVDIIKLTQELDAIVNSNQFNEHPKKDEIYNALQAIKKRYVSKDSVLVAEDYDDLETPRTLIEIEKDFQQYVKDYKINTRTAELELAARKHYAKMSGLAWLDKKQADSDISNIEKRYSNNTVEILNSRKWQIRSEDAYAMFDIQRIIYNLGKKGDVLDMFPQIADLIKKINKSIRQEQIVPSNTIIEENQFIGFKKNEEGILVFDYEYDKKLNDELISLKELEKLAEYTGFKALKKILNKQYLDVLRLKEEYYKGSIVEMFLETISAEKNAHRMLRPISKSYLVGKDENDRYLSNSAMALVQELNLVEQTDLDLSNYNDVYRGFKSVSDMQRMTGIFASAIKVLAYISRSGVSSETQKSIIHLNEVVNAYNKTLSKVKPDSPIEEFNKVIKLEDQVRELTMEVTRLMRLDNADKGLVRLPKISDKYQFSYKISSKETALINGMNEFVLGTDNLVSIYDILDSLVNIAIDNIKDQELFALQATVETGPLYAALISLGLPAKDIVSLLYTPAYQSMLNLARNDSTFKLSNLSEQYIKHVRDAIANKVSEEDLQIALNPIENAIGIKEIREILENPIFKLPVTTSGRKITDVPGLDKLSVEELKKLYQSLHILQSGLKLGDFISDMSKVLSILRDMPISFKGIEDVQKALSKLGNFLENSEDADLLANIDVLDRDAILELLNNLSSPLYTKKVETAYKVEGFFSQNPHIYSAYRRLLQLKALIQEKFAIYSPNVIKFLQETFGAGEAKISDTEGQEILRTELRRYLASQIIPRDLYNQRYSKSIVSRKRKRPITKKLYGVDAWAQRFVDTVKRVKQADAETAAREGREPNPFLEALYLDGDKLKIVIENDLDPVIVQELQDGFEELAAFSFDGNYLDQRRLNISKVETRADARLSNFNLEYNATEFQLDFLYYLALVDNLRFSNTNYSVAIPPRITKIFDKKRYKIEQQFKNNEDGLRDKLSYPIKIELLRENASAIGEYIDSDTRENYLVKNSEEETTEEKDKTFQNSQGKVENQPRNGVFINSKGKKVYYDVAYNNPFEVPGERNSNKTTINQEFPLFITEGFEDDTQVYMRVTDHTEGQLAYISLGKAVGAYTRINDLDKVSHIADNFSTDMPTQYVDDTKSDILRTKKNFDYLEEGEPLRLVNYADKSRIEPRLVIITGKTPYYRNVLSYDVETKSNTEKQVLGGWEYTLEDYVPNEAANMEEFVSVTRELDETPKRATKSNQFLKSTPSKTPVFMGIQELMQDILDGYTKLDYKELTTETREILRLATTQLNTLKANNSNPLVIAGKYVKGQTGIASYVAYANIITINPNKDLTKLELLKLLTHEVVHVNTGLLIASQASNPYYYYANFNSRKKIDAFKENHNQELLELNEDLDRLSEIARTAFKEMKQGFTVFGERLTPKQREVLEGTFTRTKDLTEPDILIPYGFASGIELLAEFSSDPSFRELTKEIFIPTQIKSGKVESRSLFGHIIDSISNFLNKILFKANNVSAEYVSLYDILEKLIEEGTFDGMNLNNPKKLSANQLSRVSKNLSDYTLSNIPISEIQKILSDYYGLETVTDNELLTPEQENEMFSAEALAPLVVNIIANTHDYNKTDEKIEELKKRSEQVEVDPANENKYQAKKDPNSKFLRVTDDVTGWLAKFRFNPKARRDIHEKADNLWGNRPETDELFTRHGKINKEDFIAKETSILVKGRNRGSIIHTIIERLLKKDPDGSLQKRLDDLYDLTGFDPNDFDWVSKKLTNVLQNAGINALDKVKDEHRDKIESEVKLFNEILGIAGTADLFVFHADGTVSIKDIKAGYQLFDDNNKLLEFGEMPSHNDLVWDTWKNHAYIQLMTYALMYKIQNPDAKFNSLDVLWMPDADAIFGARFRNPVPVDQILPMIRRMMEAKMPNELARLKTELGEQRFNALWKPSEYTSSYSKDLRNEMNKNEDYPIAEQIQIKLQKIRSIILSDLNPNNYNKGEFSGEKAGLKNKQVSKLMAEVLELQKRASDLEVQSVNEDISSFQYWLFTANTTSSPYIQTWDHMFMKKRAQYLSETERMRNEFLSLQNPLKEIYYSQNPGRALVNAITRGGIPLVEARKFYAFAFKTVEDKNGNVINLRLRHSEADFKELVNDNTNFGYINASNIHLYKNYLAYINENYARFFVDKDGKKALANRPASTRRGPGGIEVAISNLELHNYGGAKFNKNNKNRDKVLFEYTDGWMPKVQPLLSEFGFTDRKSKLKGSKASGAENWMRVWYQRNLTFTEETKFEGFDKRSIAEGLPMKYLNTEETFTSNPDFYSLNLEYQFDKFTKSYLWKEYMDDVFAYGQAIRIMLNTEGNMPDGDLKDKTVKMMKRELDLKVRGKPAGWGSSDDRFMSHNKYNFSMIKALQAIKSLSSYPILGLNYVGGSANAIFITASALKTSVINTGLKRVKLDGLNADEWDFDFKDFVKAFPEVMKVVEAAMKDGDIRKSKVYLLAKKFGYLPNNFDWSTAPNNITTSTNRAFTSDIMFMFYSMPEEFIATMVMTAQLMSMKITHGSLAGTTLYDMYEMVDKTDRNGNTYKDIQWKLDPTTNKPYVRAYKNISADPNNPQLQELTELDELEIRRFYSVYDKMQGGYRNIDKTALDYSIWGQLAIQFRRFLPHILRQGGTSAAKRSNLGYYKVVSVEDGKPTVEWVSKVMEGRWKVIGKVLLNAMGAASIIQNIPEDAEGIKGSLRRMSLGLENYNLSGSKLDPGQREALMDAYVTLGLMFAGLAFMLGGGGGGDDKDPAYKYGMRIFNDVTQMYNFYELGKNLTSWDPPSLKKLHNLHTNMMRFGFSVLLWGTGDAERAFNQSDGRLKGFNQLANDLPIFSAMRKTEIYFDTDIFGEY